MIAHPPARPHGTMLGLLDLPPEILLAIARLVGGGRCWHAEALLLCKAWYNVARLVALEDVALDHRLLTKYLAAPELVRASARHLSIDADIVTPINLAIEAAGVQRLCGDLEALAATHLATMRRLASFALRPRFHTAEILWDGGVWATALAKTVAALPSGLTRLTIDIPSHPQAALVRTRTWPVRDHLCPLLLGHLPSLQHLRVRVPDICPALFDVGEAVGEEAQLRTLVVNLSVGPDGVYDALHALDCCDARPDLYRLGVKMLSGAMAAAPRFPHLRSLRIVHPVPAAGSGRLSSHDVVSGRTVVFSDDVPWDDIDRIDRSAVDCGEGKELSDS